MFKLNYCFKIYYYYKLIFFLLYRWGLKIKKRMGKVEQWAEKQGLELAAGTFLFCLCILVLSGIFLKIYFFFNHLFVYLYFRLSPSSSRPSSTFTDG